MPCKPVKGWQGILFFIISNISINNNGTHSFLCRFLWYSVLCAFTYASTCTCIFLLPYLIVLHEGASYQNRVRYTNFIYSFFTWLPRGMYHFPSSLLVEIIFPQKITYMGLVYKWMGGISNSCVLAKAAPQGRQKVGAKGGTGPPPIFEENKKGLQRKQKYFQQKTARSSLASVILDCVLRPSRQAYHNWSLSLSLFLISSRSNAQGASRAPEGCCVNSKSPSRVRDWDEEVAGRNGRE